MSFTGLLFLILTQFAIGRGILQLFGIRQKLIMNIAMSSLLGIGVVSLLPMLLEMFHQPINKTNIIISICVAVVLANAFVLHRYNYGIFRFKSFKLPSIPIYELLFIILFALLLTPSVWRCYFYPSIARDALSGPEVLAEYALKEHKIANSVFDVNLMVSTPNLLKPPFLTDLQIIYKLLVHPFGQVWLSIIALCFTTWLYCLVRQRLHPLMTGIVMMLFITIPELYAYTYIILWDYSNMAFFFGGFYFLYQYIQTKEYNIFLFSALLFGFATWVRLDSLIFTGFAGAVLFFHLLRDKTPIFKTLYTCAILLIVPLAFYFTWVNIFVKHYLPVGISLGSELNPAPVSLYFKWLKDITALAFGPDSVSLYGLFINMFLLFLAIDVVFFRKFSKEAIYMLIGIVIIYFGMPLMAYFTLWFNITTAKRGIFKMFPMIILYLSNSAFFQYLSRRIINFESGEGNAPPTKAATAPRVHTQQRKK
jgi:hypothetical protein